MRLRTLAVLTLGLAVAAAGGCKRKEAPARAPIAAAAPAGEAPSMAPPADAGAPFSYAAKSPHAQTTLKLPISLAHVPELHTLLYAEEVRRLKTFAEEAVEDRAEDDAAGQPPFVRTDTWTGTAETGRLISLRLDRLEFRGGAHPNSSLEAVIWDKTAQRALTATGLFKPKSDLTGLNAALCDAIRTARRQRAGAVADTPCPAAASVPAALAPSTIAGKAGGLTFLIGPYLVGPYAEGPYFITLPASSFQDLVDPAYAGEFAGAPPAVGDTTPKR